MKNDAIKKLEENGMIDLKISKKDIIEAYAVKLEKDIASRMEEIEKDIKLVENNVIYNGMPISKLDGFEKLKEVPLYVANKIKIPKSNIKVTFNVKIEGNNYAGNSIPLIHQAKKRLQLRMEFRRIEVTNITFHTINEDKRNMSITTKPSPSDSKKLCKFINNEVEKYQKIKRLLDEYRKLERDLKHINNKAKELSASLTVKALSQSEAGKEVLKMMRTPVSVNALIE